MKYKITNICDRQVTENLGIFRFRLEPEESIIISDLPDTTATQLVHFIKAARGPRGQQDLKFEPVLEDKEVVKVLEKQEEKFVPKKSSLADVLGKQE